MDPVYRGFDQDTLDREYTPSSCVDSLAPFIAAYRDRSAQARAALQWRAIAYGPGEAETVDFFPATVPNAPLHVFIHGGYWRQLSKRESSFAAPGFIAAGAAFAAVDYALAPSVDLDEIVRQVRSAIAHLYRNAAALGIDPTRIHLSGSSAGGHLTGIVMATDWTADFGLPQTLVRGGTPISGLMDLDPVRLCVVNGWMGMTPDTVARLSPQHHLPHPGTRVIAAVGDIETAEFKRQTAEYATACRAAGLDCVDLIVPGRNHFDIVFDIADPATALGRLVFDQMGLR